LQGELAKAAADPFRECSRFVGRFCFLPNVSRTGLAAVDRIKTVMFSEAGGVTVG